MKTQVAENVYWVGAIDWNVRNFHGYTYTTHRGTTYNAYLILDEKVVLVDTVKAEFTEEMVDRIKELVDPAEIDIVVANHGEKDHSGAIPAVMELAPRAKLVGTAKVQATLARYFSQQHWQWQTVCTGEELRLGQKTLTFLEAPMLHWPVSMFTYLPEDRLLLPNDGFGQHIASSQRFADQIDGWVVFDEAAKYYANILWPFGRLILRKLEEVQKMGIEISTIAPSHGLIWRGNPGPADIIQTYINWARGEAEPRAVIAYETMWGSTERIARSIAEGIMEEGVEVVVRGLPMSDTSDVIKELLGARGLLVGSSTHNNDMLLNMAAFLEDLKGLRPTGKIGAAFGSHGWAGRAVQNLGQALREVGVEVVDEGFSYQFAPDQDELAQAVEFGRRFAQRLKTS
jgi:anaerobic nitric oxide reductase flavorubredoxin